MASQNEIPITDLPPQQLQQLAQNLEQELEFMQNSLQGLKVCQQKFIESQESLSKVDKEKAGKEILVPLTSSMYVPGHLEETDKVLIDIGVGYYVEKNVKGAEEHFKKKIEFVTKQMEKLQPVLQEKFKMKQAVMEILQLKAQAMQQAQAQEAK